MKTINHAFLREIFSHYDFNIDQYIGYKVISQGHINSTFVLYFDYGNKVKRYLLQEINSYVFKDTEMLMNNIESVTLYGKGVLKSASTENYKNKILRLYDTKDNKTYITLSDGSSWRVYHYTENCVTHDTSIDPKVFKEAGKVIGNFQKLFDKYPIENLGYVIPDFHNTIKRLANFKNSLTNANKERIAKAQPEIDFILNHEDVASAIQNLLDTKQMPLRVTHNDTKLNNIMFEYATNKGMCLIDLDTIMPGSICFDFGDFVRSACNPVAEDCKELDKVIFSKNLCLAFAEGFIKSMDGKLTEIEAKNLIMGAIDMTYECGMRFINDYLDGNKYFHVEYEDHNLDRARTQFKMCQQLLDNKVDLDNKILKFFKKYQSE